MGETNARSATFSKDRAGPAPRPAPSETRATGAVGAGHHAQ
jgi:hypothetical protein